jgi:hypothetical protein
MEIGKDIVKILRPPFILPHPLYDLLNYKEEKEMNKSICPIQLWRRKRNE